MKAEWLIYNANNGQFWGPNGGGYFGLWGAGLYTEEEAKRIVSNQDPNRRDQAHHITEYKDQIANMLGAFERLNAVLESADPAGGRTQAAALFGAVFTRFQTLAWGAGGAVILLLILRAVLGPRPRPFALRLTIAASMLAVSLASGLMIAPRIDQIRHETSGTVASLPDDDPRKAEFGRLHGLSNGLMALTLVAGAWMLWVEMKDPH